MMTRLAGAAVSTVGAKLEVRSTGAAMASRTVPFVLFMTFIAADEGCRLLIRCGVLDLEQTALYYLYPIKAALVAALLLWYRNDYEELSFRSLAVDRRWVFTSLAGIATVVLWISMASLPLAGSAPGFDPTLLPAGPVRLFMIISRVAGAVLVVPVMEELFWRSFLLRYLIKEDFESVPLGQFTWSSFLITAILFGLEHHLFLAGVAAGMIYNVILYRTRSLDQCVLAHAVTNLALACYVLCTGNWQFW